MPIDRSHRIRARRTTLLGTTLLALSLAFGGCSDGSDAEPSSTSEAGDATERTTKESTTTTATAAEVGVDVDQTSPAGANGIKVADDGSLWIASLASDVILRVDAATGQILDRVTAPTGSGPDDLALAPDGTLYWTGYLSGDVGIVVPGGPRAEVLTNVGAGANPIARRDDGTLVVGRAGAATGLYTFDPDSEGSPVPLSDPGNLNSFDITPEGLLYAPAINSASVLEIDAATGATIRTVAPVDGAPIALRWHDGAIYVLVLSDAARVFRVHPTSGASELFADTGLPSADNLAVAADGRVYVTGLSVPTVTVLGADGAVEQTLRIGSAG